MLFHKLIGCTKHNYIFGLDGWLEILYDVGAYSAGGKELKMNEQSVSSLYELYKSRKRFADCSVAIKDRAVRYFIEFFGDLEVKEVNYTHAEDYQAMLYRGRSEQSVNIYTRNVKPFFQWLTVRGYLRVSPFAELTEYPIGARIRKIFEPAEIARLMRVSNLRWRVVIMLGLLGLRRGDVLNLTVADMRITEKDSYLMISPKTGANGTWAWKPKSRDQAIASVPPVIKLPDMVLHPQSMIAELIAELPQGQPYLTLTGRQYMKMMARKEANSLTADLRVSPWSSFSRDFRDLQRRAGVEPGRFHDLRGTFATTMFRNGANLKETQMAMRHKSSSTTMEYYIKVENEQLAKKTATIMATCFSGEPG